MDNDTQSLFEKVAFRQGASEEVLSLYNFLNDGNKVTSESLRLYLVGRTDLHQTELEKLQKEMEQARPKSD